MSEFNKDEGFEVRAMLDELQRGLKGGLRFANLLGSINQTDIGTATILLNALIEILISKGVVHLAEIEQRKELLSQAAIEREQAAPHVQLTVGPDKYEVTGCDIDCAARTSLCHSACCTFSFSLSVQDLDEGVVKWDYLRPYGIARDANGYCVHFDYRERKCTIYDQRPAVCRGYSCRDDRRVWKNFENRILNPEIAGLKAAPDV